MSGAVPAADQGPSAQALRVIEAQRHADEIVSRVAAGELEADALALELGKAYGATLQALARSLTKAVRGAA